MAEVYNEYLQRRLVDVALLRRRIKPLNVSGVPLENIRLISDNLYLVKSTSSEDEYEIDLMLGCGTCSAGNTGVVCKHQVGCSEHYAISLQQMFEKTAAARQQLVILALGDKNDPNLLYFEKLTNVNGSAENISGSGEITNMTQSANEDAQVISTVISSQIEEDYIINEAKINCVL